MKHYQRETPHPIANISSIRYIGNHSDNHAMYEVVCADCGHTWIGNKYRLEHHYCKMCATINRRTSIDRYVKEGTDKNLILLDDKAPANRSLYANWQCKYNHEFSATLDMVMCAKTPCPVCRDNSALNATLDKITKYIPIKKPSGMTDRVLWLCENGHWFSSTAALIEKIQGCPLCLDDSKHEEHQYIPRGAYVTLGMLRKPLTYVATEVPPLPSDPAVWMCSKCLSEIKASYNDVLKKRIYCPKCGKPKNYIINGKRASLPQRIIFNNLPFVDKAINYYIADKCADIVLFGQRTIIEYDGKSFHETVKDQSRNTKYIEAGWRVLILKSGKGGIPETDDLLLWLNSLDTEGFIEKDLDEIYGESLKFPYPSYAIKYK